MGIWEIRDMRNTVLVPEFLISQRELCSDGQTAGDSTGVQHGKGEMQDENHRWSVVQSFGSGADWPFVYPHQLQWARVLYNRSWTEINIDDITCHQIANIISVVQSGQKAHTHTFLKCFYVKRIQDSCPSKTPCFVPALNVGLLYKNLRTTMALKLYLWVL